MTPEKANQIAAEFICEGMQYGDPTQKLAQLFVTYCTPAAGRARDDGYQLGNNCAGETAAQVANFITGDYVRLGGRVKLGNDVTIGDGVTINESPVYLWPRGGQFPVYVSDADKRLVGIGCCVLEIAEWFNGAGAYLASVYKMKDTRVYEDALRTVAMMMGWEVPGGETKRCDGSTRISIAKLLAQWKGKK